MGIARTVSTTRRIVGIPVMEVAPAGRDPRGPVLWIPPLGGDKERYTDQLNGLAQRGFLAVGIDPRRHGERADLPPDRLFELVMNRFRATMWPILGGTVLDAMAVIDEELSAHRIDGPVLAGGVSMGGDIAIALAGIDPRVTRVAAIASTPDWTRPGMTLIGRPGQVIDQGEATSGGRWLRDHLDPLAHPDRFRRELAIRLDVGAADTHVPAEAAHRFAALLADGPPAPQIAVVDHPGLDHPDLCRDPQVLGGALSWLTGPS
ncbi:alpha/beta hydrolase family protein [Acidipropionibacterium virtanenii]|uniref:Peptidase S9 prolyl oligopeptidase catalytic domain-containing protein n=1 Tax=Acidipropionibacterium virtanenii TaxID=2057246 RepID=A0A344UUB8_9ACTN|nr:hypothetical protein [Acidipropionibacterium virtanenii]AXE38866.1 hypothetical protein JS278_01703 [Acidipropionibacterium virtanenii]